MRQEWVLAGDFPQVSWIPNQWPSSKDGAIETIFEISYIIKLTSAACKPIEHMAYWI